MLKRLAGLWPYLRPYRTRLALGFAAILLSIGIGLVAPLLIGRAIDTLRTGVTREALLVYSALLVLIAFGQGVFSYTQRTLLVGMSRDIEYDLLTAYFRHLETQPPSFFHRHFTGDLMARATNDVQAVRMLCGPAIMYGSATVLASIGALALMLRIHPPLTFAALATMPLVALVTKVFGERVHNLFEKVQGQFSSVSSQVQESLAGVRVVRAYAQEHRQAEEFDRRNREYVERNLPLIRWTAAMHPLLQLLVGVGFATVLWYGGLLVARGALTIGELVTFNFFLARLVWPMIALGWVVNLAQRGTASLGRIQEILDTPPAIVDEGPLVDPGDIRGDVRFAGLDFAYAPGAEPVLRHVDVHVPAGATVAVVGRTGAGKSTLLSLLPRLVEPPRDTLFVDGFDVRRLPLARLRSGIGMVPQETFLFSATVGENIALGRPEASREEVETAALLAGLGPDLAAFPQGLETLVGERGLTLSGGQKQRVALARALVRRPRILLLDDCLSAVDTETEERILRNLRRVFVGRTVFLVSHRISTVKEADLILVLDRGEIVERGTHAELLALGGLYADLHQRQVLEEELAAV